MSTSSTIATGTVYLVGAGPGDPGLITVNGLRHLEAGDVVVYDRLVDPRLLGRVRSDAELIDAGKSPGAGRDSQGKINETLVAKAREGKSVVRLKGGDPFVFGRGGEEAAALSAAGIRFEVVPGVTSAVAAPAYAGIPLTHRDYASSVTLLTGVEGPGKMDPAVSWGQLAQAKGTLVVLMGWEALADIVSGLGEGGMASDTLVAVVKWGTEPYQRTVVGTLTDIVERSRDAGLSPPVVVVIGSVVALRDRTRWFDNRPLFGKRVMVARSRSQASALSELLSKEGAQPLEVPTIEIRPLDDYGELDEALGDLSDHNWVLFVSANAVEAVFSRMAKLNLDARAFGPAKVAAIGSATAEALRGQGIAADYIPKEAVSESVVEGLGTLGLDGAKVLLPRTDIGSEALSKGLEARGASVREVIAYRTVTPDNAGERAAEILAQAVDVATFTSSSTVGNLVAVLNGDLQRLGNAKIACIGPVTAVAAKQVGLDVDIVAEESTVGGLVAAIKDHYAGEHSSDG